MKLEKQIFPMWFYHKEILPQGKIVQSIEEYQNLGHGWVESPALFYGAVSSETCPTSDAETKLEEIKEIVIPKRGPKRKPQVINDGQ